MKTYELLNHLSVELAFIFIRKTFRKLFPTFAVTCLTNTFFFKWIDFFLSKHLFQNISCTLLLF